MSNWIIEADIYRLEKALAESVYEEERSRLTQLLVVKRKLLNIAPPLNDATLTWNSPVMQKPAARGRKRTPLALL